jgi:hypothetical protein
VKRPDEFVSVSDPNAQKKPTPSINTPVRFSGRRAIATIPVAVKDRPAAIGTTTTPVPAWSLVAAIAIAPP